MKHLFSTLLLAPFILASCSDGTDEPDLIIDPVYASLYVVNAGNFMQSNSSITSWTSDSVVSQEVFFKANRFKLGDAAQSMAFYGDKAWIVVNNSNVVFAVDAETFKEVGRIDNGLVSPRYIHFISGDKAYITQMYSSDIAVVNPKTYEVIGQVKDSKEVYNGGNTEEMVQIGDYVYVNCWSYDNRILKIDTRTDEIVMETEVGKQPVSLVKDADDNLWTICDGGWDNHPLGWYEAPSLLCLDSSTLEVKKRFEFKIGDWIAGKMFTDNQKKHIYWIINSYDDSYANVGGIFCMDIKADKLPSSPLIALGDKNFYAASISPVDSMIFAADCLDWQQSGVIYRYSSSGDYLGKFDAGIIPTSFAWKVGL